MIVFKRKLFSLMLFILIKFRLADKLDLVSCCFSIAFDRIEYIEKNVVEAMMK